MTSQLYWKGLSWQLVIILSYLKIALTISIETYNKFSQLVSTSNKRPSTGEMKNDQKRVGLYGELDLTPILIKDDLWRLKFTPHCEADWSMISVTFRCEETHAIKSDTCECVFTLCREFEDEEMTLLNSYQSAKELGLSLNLENLKLVRQYNLIL